MPTYDIGAVLKKLRTQKNISQEALAYPIIDRATLSKIESGKTMPHRRTLEHLFERLGHNLRATFDHFIHTKETASENVVQKLIGALVQVRRTGDNREFNEKVEGLIGQLEQDEEYLSHPLNRQFLLSAKARYAYNTKDDENAKRWIYEALDITLPDFDEDKVEGYLLSMNETNIIYQLAILYNETGHRTKAIHLLRQVKANIDTSYVDPRGHARFVSTAIYNLARVLFMADEAEEALALCEEGMRLCLEHNECMHFKAIAWYKAQSLLKLGFVEDFLTLARSLYHAFDVYQEAFSRDYVRDVTLTETGVDLAEGLPC